MSSIAIKLDKSIEQNASLYYEKAKKAKKKLAGAEEALHKAEKKLDKLKQKKGSAEKAAAEKTEMAARRKKELYEKFRWFFTSEGFLVIGGRDATTNEIVIKKHAGKDDVVFHTDMAGSPFFVLKAEGRKPSEKSLKETADATASFSRAWKLGLSATDVFYIKPEQVTKEAQHGEYLAKGAFMIKGKTTYIDNEMRLAAGVLDGKIMCGAADAVKAHCKKYLEIMQGDEKPSDIAKKIKKQLGHRDIDEIIRALPAGRMRIK